MAKALIGNRRSTFEIAHEILSVCDNGGTNKTAIMYGSNLSYRQLQWYLSLLSGQELIYRDDDGKFKLIAEGEKALGQISTVMWAFQGQAGQQSSPIAA